MINRASELENKIDHANLAFLLHVLTNGTGIVFKKGAEEVTKENLEYLQKGDNIFKTFTNDDTGIADGDIERLFRLMNCDDPLFVNSEIPIVDSCKA